MLVKLKNLFVQVLVLIIAIILMVLILKVITTKRTYSIIPKAEAAESIPEKIKRIAIEKGANPKLALAIAFHESSFISQAIGDKDYICLNPKSRYYNQYSPSYGLFQINLCWHPDVSKYQALNSDFAIVWAMPEIKNHPQIWMTWFTYSLWETENLNLED